MSKFQLVRSLLQLLLGTKVVGVSAASLAAVGSSWRESGVAFAADHLLAVVLLRQHAERWFDDATAETQHQVERRLLLDVVVGQSATVLELLAGEDQTLLVRRNSLFVLNLGFDILNGVAWLDLKGDGLSRQSFHENLHFYFPLKRIYLTKRKVLFLKYVFKQIETTQL